VLQAKRREEGKGGCKGKERRRTKQRRLTFSCSLLLGTLSRKDPKEKEKESAILNDLPSLLRVIPRAILAAIRTQGERKKPEKKEEGGGKKERRIEDVRFESLASRLSGSFPSRSSLSAAT